MFTPRPLVAAASLALLLVPDPTSAVASPRFSRENVASKLVSGRTRVVRAGNRMRRGATVVGLAATTTLATLSLTGIGTEQGLWTGVAAGATAAATALVHFRPWRRLSAPRRRAEWEKTAWSRQFRGYTTGKPDYEINEDRWARSADGSVYALADGVSSNTNSSDAFAEALVNAFVAEPGNDLASLVQTAGRGWAATVADRNSVSLFDEDNARESGGQATFLGLRRGKASFGRRAWDVFALTDDGLGERQYSDSVAFRVNSAGKVLEAYPPVDEFGSRPVLAQSNNPSAVKMGRRTMRTARGEYILLTTDAIAARIVKTTDARGVSSFARELLETPDGAAFSSLVNSARGEGMTEDDSTALVIPHE